MKHILKFRLVILTLICLSCSKVNRNLPDDSWIKIRVDPTLELFCTIHRLAKTGQDATRELPYISEIWKCFGSFRNHRAVRLAKGLWETHRINVSALTTLIVYLDSPPDLATRNTLDPLPSELDSRWTSDVIPEFIDAAKEFAVDTKFMQFLDRQKELFDRSVMNLNEALKNENMQAWCQGYFGYLPDNFTIIIGMQTGWGNYGASMTRSDGTREFFSIIGANSPSLWSGIPTFSPARLIPTVVHEFCHPYVNPLIEQYKELLKEPGEILYSRQKAKLAPIGCLFWNHMMNEYIVRACVIRYFRSKKDMKLVNRQIRYDEDQGFIAIRALADLFEEYEKNRNKYPNINSFFPRIADCLKQYAMSPGEGAYSSGHQIIVGQKLQRTLDRAIQKYKVRGVSAAVIFPDRQVWTGVSGFSHDSVPIKPDMIFAIGSITKNFVATLILQLAEEGVLSLDDSLSRWLPAYPHVDSTITIRQLLNHTSGIFMFWDNQKLWDDLIAYRDSVFTPEVVLTYLKEPHFAPGKGWRYSNTNYLLLAMIAARATHSTLSAEFRRRFWQPLGFTNTYLSMEEQIPDRLAHVWGDNFENDGSDRDLTYLPRASHESITYGSSGIFTTAEELARWCYALFEGKILHPQSMNEMLQFVGREDYGLGIGLFNRRISSGEKAVGHAGANIGTSAYMIHLPDHHVSVAVMVNSMNHEWSEAITKGLIRDVLKELKVIGIIPYFDFHPAGFVVIGCAIIILINIRLYIKRRLKTKTAS